MDNSKIGGKGNDFVERRSNTSVPETFEDMFRTEQSEVVSNPENQSRSERGLGEVTTSEVMREILSEVGNEKNEKFEVPDIPEMMPVTEMKPLVADGTTEKKLGHTGVSLVGDRVDAEGIGIEVKKIKELPLYEQSAARDAASAKMIYANFGRMIGNDDIGEIQAEEATRNNQIKGGTK